MSDNQQIGDRLREEYRRCAKRRGTKPRTVRLPGSREVQFQENGPDVHIHLLRPAVTANMQTNSAGFEGWSLALVLWLKFRSVTLHWSPYEPLNGDSASRHYGRFLYRVQRFAAMFPEWFRIGTPEHLEDCAVKNGLDLFLNVSGAISKKPDDPKREMLIERALVEDHPNLLREAFGLELIGRQFPVGLYKSADLKGPVFTGGTSAIDLVGRDADRFTIIELKAGNNIRVGVLAEILFYAAVIRDAVGTAARFRFGGKVGGKSHSDVRSTHVSSAKEVRAILLAEQFHPLLEHPELFPTLNRASAQQAHPVPLSFEAWRLKDYETHPTLERLDT